MKLTEILDEIVVNKPLSKREILQYIINEEILDIANYFKYEDYLNEIWEDEETLKKEHNIEYIKAYFKMFKPNEIIFSIIESDETSNNTGNGYKYYATKGEDDGMIPIIFHNIEGIKT